MEATIKLESLDTGFVNLARLIRFLREREFTGRLHVVLDQYEADVFLNAGVDSFVSEIDHSTGREAQGEAALQRLLVRAQEPGGTITIHKRTAESSAAVADEPLVEITEAGTMADARAETESQVNWERLSVASSELIAAVERAVQTTGEDFAEYFQSARIELGDDFPFIDPTLGDFEYGVSGIRTKRRPSVVVYVNSISACLAKVVSNVAKHVDSTRFHERVAAELAIAARKNPDALAEFTPHLDRIAGTRVL